MNTTNTHSSSPAEHDDTMDEFMNNPSGCLAYAHFFAVMTNQTEVSDLLSEKMAQFSDVLGEMIADGTLASHQVDFSSGTCGMQVQQFLEATRVQDDRVNQLREIAKVRFFAENDYPLVLN